MAGMESTKDSATTPAQPDAADRAVRLAQLIDLYGPLLTDRQRQFLQLHFEEDLSFGEIAREFNVSRQAVHDAVKHAEQALEGYDEKLGFSLDEAPRRTAPAESTTEKQSAAPRPVEGLGPCITALSDIHDRLRRSGGVIYNADGITRDVAEVLDKLRQLDAEK